MSHVQKDVTADDEELDDGCDKTHMRQSALHIALRRKNIQIINILLGYMS